VHGQQNIKIERVNRQQIGNLIGSYHFGDRYV